MDKVGMDLHFYMEKKGGEEDQQDNQMDVDTAEPEEPFFCKVCDATVREGSNKHNKSQLHTLRKRYWERLLAKQKCDETFKDKGLCALTGVETIPVGKANLEVTKWFSVARQPLIGIEYIYEIQPFDVRRSKEKRFYACRLCGESNMPVFTHIVSIAHRVNYMIEHHEGILPFIQKERMNGDLLKDLIEKKGYPIHRPAWSGTRINMVLSGFCSELKAKYIKVNKQMPTHQAIADNPNKIQRQLCLYDQIQGQQKLTHYTQYPDMLLKILWNHGENFALYEKKPEPKDYDDDDKIIVGRMTETGNFNNNPYAGGPPPQPSGIGNGNMNGMRGGPQGGMQQGGMQQGGMQHGGMQQGGGMPQGGMQQGNNGQQMPQTPPKVTLLAWMHKTAQKLDAEPVQATEFEMLQRVMDLLKCGVKVYMANPSPKDICFYPDKLGNPDRMLLKEWLQLSIKYFEESWLCSDREVNMARVLVEQIDNARKRYLEAKSRPAPLTMGQAASKMTMGEAASNLPPSDPYAALEEPENQALFNGLVNIMSNTFQGNGPPGGFNGGPPGPYNNGGPGGFNDGPPGRFNNGPGGFNDGPPGRYPGGFNDGPPGRFNDGPGGFDGPRGGGYDGPRGGGYDGPRGGRRGGNKPYHRR